MLSLLEKRLLTTKQNDVWADYLYQDFFNLHLLRKASFGVSFSECVFSLIALTFQDKICVAS